MPDSFLLYRKLLSCKVKNAPRGCTLRRIRQMSQATAAGGLQSVFPVVCGQQRQLEGENSEQIT